MLDLNHSLLDMHFARFLASRSGLTGEGKRTFETVVRDLSAALAAGHSCLPVRKQEEEILAGTTLVSAGDLTPLVLTDGRLYLHRYFTYEVRLAAQIQELAGLSFPVPESRPLLDTCFSPDANEEDLQKKAAEMAMQKALCIISGGPGTGKTSTVVRIIGLLLQAFGTDLQVALAAPTGKAAMRLSQSVGGSLETLPFPGPVKAAIPTEARTLHRLLGARKDSPRFRHTKGNPLPWDVVVVDEASMVDLAMMSKLVDALKPGSRLLLLGDKDQLASVESGAVLIDLVRALPKNTVELQKTYRFDTSIKLLSQAVNRGDNEAAWQLLTDPDSAHVGLLEKPLSDFVGDRYALYMAQAVPGRGVGYEQVFATFNGFRVLCAVRHGHRGVEGINAMVEQHLAGKGYDCLSKIWYPGRPILITRNDYSLDLSNGDIGICLPDPADGVLKVWFERPDGTLRNCLPYRLPPCETAYALTVHKCQGSEFDEVLVVLPEHENRILSRELIYTAVTRAKKRVLMATTKKMLQQALALRIDRFSGLKNILLQLH
jgi:exodeoxyribonuclease V alpha subunit